MKSIIENGGLTIDTFVMKIRHDIGAFVIKTRHDIGALVIFNAYLNLIHESIDVDELRTKAFMLENDLYRNKIDNPFSSGFSPKGFEVYYTESETTVIFVECEVDIEM